jgi:hypothetical protein
MNVSNLTVVAVLTGWSIWSIINQTSFSFAKRLKRFDVINFVPRWTFFAPIPGRTDYHLVYRDISEDLLDRTAWIELVPVAERSWWAIVWNPRKRIRKALIDLTQMMSQIGLEYPDSNALVLSLPYLAVLNHVMHQPRGYLALRQFAVVETTSAASEPAIILRSEGHRF